MSWLITARCGTQCSKRGITQYMILQDKVLDNHTLDRLKKNMNITLITLERICTYLDCTPNDVIRFTK